MIFGYPLLSVAIWLPILFGLLVLATGNDRNAKMARTIALVGAILSFLVTIPLYTGFDRMTSDMQFVEMKDWITRFNIHYHLGVDGISVLFVLLNSFFTPLVVIAGWQVIEKRVSQYMAAFLIMSGLVNGVFVALDAMLFYVFWEAMLIPMFIIIGVWGGPNRVYAALKFFLYTLLGSLVDAGCPAVPVSPVRRQFRNTGLSSHGDAIADGAGSGVHRILHGVLGESADVAGTYLVAGCAR